MQGWFNIQTSMELTMTKDERKKKKKNMNMIIQGWEIQGSKEKRAKRLDRDCKCSAKIKFFLEFNPMNLQILDYEI